MSCISCINSSTLSFTYYAFSSDPARYSASLMSASMVTSARFFRRLIERGIHHCPAYPPFETSFSLERESRWLNTLTKPSCNTSSACSRSGAYRMQTDIIFPLNFSNNAFCARRIPLQTLIYQLVVGHRVQNW